MVIALTRRDILAIAGLSSVCGCPVLAQSTAPAVNENHPDFFSPDIPDLVSQGTDPALGPEVQKALELISKAPTGGMVIDVMSYLEGLTDKNIDNEFYNAGWRTRWNPVIVTFFTATHTKPSGDVTPWCAACVNWCLARVGYLGTGSAVSGSFRSVPGQTGAPQKGDIVVFRNTNDAEARVGRGHVALFLEQNADSIFVLGGNQKNSFGHHAVCRKWIPKSDGTLTFHSYHSIAALRGG